MTNDLRGGEWTNDLRGGERRWRGPTTSEVAETNDLRRPMTSEVANERWRTGVDERDQRPQG